MIRSLHALRFIFALMVFMSHLNYMIPVANKFWSFLYRYIFREGYIGVNFFFILSGYILAYRYADAIRQKRFSFKIFFGRRLARVLPMYYSALIIALPLSYAELVYGDAAFYVRKLISNIFLVQSMIPISDYYFSFNGVSWSISTELFFYLSFPLITAFLIQQRSIKKVFIIWTLMILVFAIILLGNVHAYYWLYISPICRIADFSLGIGLYLIGENTKFSISRKQATQWEYAALGLLLLFLLVQPYVHANFKLSIYYWIPISFIIVVFANFQGRIAAFLSANIWVTLGHLSFSFYLLHHTLFKYYQQYVMPDVPAKWAGMSILGMLGMSILISYIAYRFIEEPTRKSIRGKLYRRHVC